MIFFRNKNKEQEGKMEQMKKELRSKSDVMDKQRDTETIARLEKDITRREEEVTKIRNQLALVQNVPLNIW